MENVFAMKMAANDSRPGGLSPSQGRKYVGFGSAPVQTPRNNSQGDVLSAVTQEFGRLSTVAASAAQSAGTKDITSKVQAPETKQQHNMFVGHTGSYLPQANRVSTKRTGTVLLISNLDYGVSNEDIKDIFSEVGDLKRYSLYFDKSGRSKGMAEVVFSRRRDAKAAVKRYNNAQLNGKPMKIEIVGTITTTSSVITPTNGTSGYQSGAPRRFTSEDVSGQNQVKASVQRKIRQSITEEYPLLESVMDDLLPKKSPLIVAKCQNHLNLVLVNNVPLFFNVRDGPYMPTLRLLHQYPNIMKALQVDRGAIKFVLAGANIMCPGLTSPGGFLDDEVAEETPVAIMAEGKQHALAIGFTKMSAKDIRAINKGIGVDNMHYLNDGLWKMEKLD